MLEVQPIRCRFEMTTAAPQSGEFCVFDFPGCKGCPRALHTVSRIGSSEDPMKSDVWNTWIAHLSPPSGSRCHSRTIGAVSVKGTRMVRLANSSLTKSS